MVCIRDRTPLRMARRVPILPVQGAQVIEFSVLGPVEVRRDGAALGLGGSQQRMTLPGVTGATEEEKMSEHSEHANECVDAIAALVLAVFVPQAAAMLAALQFDLFTALEESPKDLHEVCRGFAWLMPRDCNCCWTVWSRRSSCSASAGATRQYRGRKHVSGPGTGALSRRVGGQLAFQWGNMLKTAESIRTGQPQGKIDWSQTSGGLEAFFRGLHPTALLRARDLLQASSVVNIFRAARNGGRYRRGHRRVCDRACTRLPPTPGDHLGAAWSRARCAFIH